MVAIVGVGLYMLSGYFLKLGLTSLNDAKNYQEYGVESEGPHKKFSFTFIFFSVLSASIATILVI